MRARQPAILLGTNELLEGLIADEAEEEMKQLVDSLASFTRAMLAKHGIVK